MKLKRCRPVSPDTVTVDPTRDLREENERLRAEVAYLKKIARLDPGEKISCADKARVILGLRRDYKLAVLLQAADLARSTSYYQRQAMQCDDKHSDMKIRIRAKRRYRHTQGSSDVHVPNVLQRDFHAATSNQKWATDITEFNVKGQKLYLSACMDLYNGEIVAHRMARRPVFELDRTDRALGPGLALRNAAAPGYACASRGDAKHAPKR